MRPHFFNGQPRIRGMFCSFRPAGPTEEVRDDLGAQDLFRVEGPRYSQTFAGMAGW
jgi:hypothetical protein